MLTPLRLGWDNDAQNANLHLQDGDGWTDIAEALVLSLFCDAAAVAGDPVPAGNVDGRGWWADGDVAIGSRIWLHLTGARNQATLDSLRDDCLRGLQWLIDDGVAESIDAQLSWLGVNAAAVITITRNGQTRRFDFAW